MKKLAISVLTIFLLQSCGTGEEEQVVTVENKYSLSVPAFLAQASDLNDDASLQYQHALQEFYVIVIDESKEEMQKALEENNLTDIYPNNLNGYSNLILDTFKDDVNASDQSELIDTVINRMPARITSLKGEVDGVKVFYDMGFYEGDHNYYQVLAWTLSDREPKHRAKMDKILRSLQEL